MNDYGMGPEGNAALAALEKTLRAHEAGLLKSAMESGPESAKEIVEVLDQNVAAFEEAAKGSAPFQKVAVGITFTVNALREWRLKGPHATTE